MATKKQVAVAVRRKAVSVATLDGIHACEPQQEKFALAFGVDRRDRVEINADNIIEAWHHGIMVDWLLYRVLARKWVAAYNTRRRAIHRKYINGEITDEQKERRQAEALARILREHWGEK